MQANLDLVDTNRHLLFWKLTGRSIDPSILGRFAGSICSLIMPAQGISASNHRRVSCYVDGGPSNNDEGRALPTRWIELMPDLQSFVLVETAPVFGDAVMWGPECGSCRTLSWAFGRWRLFPLAPSDDFANWENGDVKDILGVKEGGGTNDVAVGLRLGHFLKTFIGMGDSSGACNADEGEGQAFVNLRTGVFVRGGLHFENLRAGNNCIGLRLGSEAPIPPFVDEGKIWSAALPVLYREFHVGIEQRDEPVEAIERFRSQVDAGADLVVLGPIFGVHVEIATFRLMDSASFGRGLRFGSCPLSSDIFTKWADSESARSFAWTSNTVAEVLRLWT